MEIAKHYYTFAVSFDLRKRNYSIRLEALTSTFSLVAGLMAFVMGFVAFSWILRKILRNTFPPEKASLGVVPFLVYNSLLGITMSISPEMCLIKSNEGKIYIVMLFFIETH